MALSDHGQYSGVVDIARNGIDEVIRLKAQVKQDEALILQLVGALEAVSGGGVCSVTPREKRPARVWRTMSSECATRCSHHRRAHQARKLVVTNIAQKAPSSGLFCFAIATYNRRANSPLKNQ